MMESHFQRLVFLLVLALRKLSENITFLVLGSTTPTWSLMRLSLIPSLNFTLTLEGRAYLNTNTLHGWNISVYSQCGGILTRGISRGSLNHWEKMFVIMPGVKGGIKFQPLIKNTSGEIYLSIGYPFYFWYDAWKTSQLPLITLALRLALLL
jgi:hypothetical protein